MTEAPTSQLPVQRLTCHAPHPDPARAAEACAAPLGAAPGRLEFVTTAERMPDEPDLHAWLRCPRSSCAQWNKFRLVPLETAVTAAAPIEERLAQLPEDQRIAVTLLAGGLGVVRTARAVGVARKTITRWTKDEVFNSIRRAIAPRITMHHAREVLEGFFDVLAMDRKKGKAANFRWIMQRILPEFAAFEQARAEAGAPSAGVPVNLTVTQVQQSLSVEAEIRAYWDQQHGNVGSSPRAASE